MIKADVWNTDLAEIDPFPAKSESYNTDIHLIS
jgi:hypothetical protein